MGIVTYKQHLFFSVILIQIKTLVPPFHKSLETCDVKFLWLLSEPRAHCPFNRVIVRKVRSPERCCFRGLLDVTGNVHRAWVSFLCEYPLLPYLLPTKTAQCHTVLSWYTYSGAPPSCNSCSVFTVMHIPIVARHNKTRYCCHLAVTVSRT